MRRVVPIAALSALLAACDLDPVGPRPSLDGLPDGLEVEFLLEPATVARHVQTVARLSLTNSTADTVRFGTGEACLARLTVLRGGTRVPMRGSSFDCGQFASTHVFAPGETSELEWRLTAELMAQAAGEVDGQPAPPGRYRVRAEFPLSSPSGRSPAIERTLRIR